ncbi:MAG: prohibitin family protein, partial [Clostridia bacterium]|nr:prohibitin family protein [Clostridia bacterium]
VDTGEIAVVKYMGEAKAVRAAGTHFDFWITNTYSKYDAKVQNLDIATAAYSSDAQTMDVTMTLQYQIMSDKAIEIAKEYGSLSVLQSRIQSIAIEKAKSVLSSYKAMDIISDRASMSPQVEDSIKNAIADKYFVTISTVVLTNIDFSDAFEKAVEDKMIAEQNQLRAEYENAAKIAAAEAEAKAAIEKAQGEAEAKLKAAEAEIQIAKAQAEAKIAQAQGEADAQLKIAQAEATALKLKSIEIARALGFTVNEAIIDNQDGTTSIEYEIDFEGKTAEEIQLITDYLKYIEYLNKWDGKLPSVMTENGANVVIPTNPIE